MRKYSFFFYYYLLITLTALFLCSLFFVPSPYKIIQVVILLPATTYLWINLTNPEGALESQWSKRIIIVILVLTLLGVFSYYLGKNSPSLLESKNSTQDRSSDEIKAYINDKFLSLKADIDAIGKAKSDTPSTVEIAKTPIGKIIINGDEDINVYDMPDETSNILGIAVPKISYSYYQKENGWYQIDYGTAALGWIKDNMIEELPR